jgi:hypothetical protein
MEPGTPPNPQLVVWVQTWQRAARPLAALRQTDLATVRTEQALRNLADAFESCRLHTLPPPESGLVRQQALFRRLQP